MIGLMQTRHRAQLSHVVLCAVRGVMRNIGSSIQILSPDPGCNLKPLVPPCQADISQYCSMATIAAGSVVVHRGQYDSGFVVCCGDGLGSKKLDRHIHPG